MNKNLFAKTPPMGWNSYDYYDTTVNEEQIKKNADYMAEHLKEYGWEYIVIDIEWYSYDAGTQRKDYQYIPFWKVEMDEYSRLLPCEERFPSAKGGKGFAPLAEYVHNLGLKFGIHIMRGIPRIAAHNHGKIYGTDRLANEIAEANNICGWNPDMYGIDPNKEGAQAYYDSLMQLYAKWKVDFVKCDDICRMDTHTCKKEIELLYHAIEKCDRSIVLSLSPGPALVEEAWHYEKYSNMWRITDDFWDNWPLLKNMFWRCELWQNHVGEGCWPDCDMLPLGKIGKAFGTERETCFTDTEQITMMNLWSIFRSPLMLGAEMTKLDDKTVRLLTNVSLIRSIQHGSKVKQLFRNDDYAIWMNVDAENGNLNLALFNLSQTVQQISIACDEVEGLEEAQITSIREAWNDKKEVKEEVLHNGTISLSVMAHGSTFFVIKLQLFRRIE